MDILKWAKENGSEHGAVNIESSPESGLLFRAAKDISPNSTIVSCSYSTMLSYLNIALPTTSINEDFSQEFIQALQIDDPNILGHFFLIQQYLLKDKSFWHPYIQLLPQPDEPERLGIPILWPEDDQKFLVGTNAEPPIKQRAQMWENDWQKAIAVLPTQHIREKYTYDLYQWAASIFGSRSFRASLTVPEDQIHNSNLSEDKKNRILEHVRLDRFSVLLPLLDLGNHNGVNEVDWSQDPAGHAFTLTNRCFIPKGNEVYNYYGDKSNSELLVAYGFTLPDLVHDVVNLKVTPGPDALSLRRSQVCHHMPQANQEGKEFMFQVRSGSPSRHTSRLPETLPFSHGLIDTMTCMVATPREKLYLSSLSSTCFETTINESMGPLPRNLIQVLYILKAKLESEISRIDTHGSSLGLPQNRNQTVALDYRNRQRQTLLKALTPISSRLSNLFTSKLSVQLPDAYPSVLSLEHAYAWLCISYPEVGPAVMLMIADDQEEELPLDWAVLVEDWDHTYWIIWVFLLLAIRGNGERTFADQHTRLDAWLRNIEINTATTKSLFAESSEEETIDSMIESILQIQQFEASTQKWVPEQHVEYRNFASYIVRECSIRGSYGDIPQELLCISYA